MQVFWNIILQYVYSGSLNYVLQKTSSCTCRNWSNEVIYTFLYYFYKQKNKGITKVLKKVLVEEATSKFSSRTVFIQYSHLEYVELHVNESKQRRAYLVNKSQDYRSKVTLSSRHIRRKIRRGDHMITFTLRSWRKGGHI